MIGAILLLGLGIIAWVGILNALRPRQSLLLILPSWIGAWFTVELAPHLVVLSGLLAGLYVALGALDDTLGWIGLGLLVTADLFALPMIWHSRRSVINVRGVLEDLKPEGDAPRYPRSHILFPALMFRRRGVRHVRGVVYEWVDERPLKLDVYLASEPASKPRPAIIEVHGGGWIFGTRKEQGIALLNHLAANGWVGFNINYRLSPWATMPDHVVDVKRAIAWVREHAEEYGVDPDFIALTGGSAGGHLTALAAVTADDQSLQPGFEAADTAVQAAVPFYGAYDFVDEKAFHSPIVHQILEAVVFKARGERVQEMYRAASPTHRVQADAPPFLVVAGERDSLISVEQSRAFVERLRTVSQEPVLYVEMKGGQHAFDLIPSWRTIPVVETVERFLTTLYERRGEPTPAVERELEEALTD